MTTAPQDKAEAVASEELESASAAGAASGIVPEGIQARFAGRTAVGLVREHNEDNLVVADLSLDGPMPREEVCEAKVSEHGLLFAVCDGMGGAAAGEVASQMAVDILFEAMRRGGPPQNRDDLGRRLVSAVEESGKRIYDEAQKERSRRGMGTTATAAVLIDKVLFVAEVGDSRAYLLRGDTMKQLTKDQSLVNQLIEAGHLTEEEAEAFEHSNIILQALGTSDSVQVDLTFVELRRGDRLMLCSDGLSGLVHDETIADTLRDVQDPTACSATLIEYAEAGGGHDNITVIVVDFDGDALTEPKDTDSFGYLQYPLPLADGDGRAFVDDETTAGGAVPVRAGGGDDFVGGDGRTEDGTAMLWLVGGVVALLIGASVLALSSGPSDDAEDGALSSGRAVEGEPPAPPVAAPPAHVPVHVHTDIEGAQLLVNGEPHGTLSAGAVHDMALSPGAYRFEAHSGGNLAAVAVETVREGVPLDVHLDLPGGADPALDELTPSDEDEPDDEGDQGAALDSADGTGADAPATLSAAEREKRREARRLRREARRKARAEGEASAPEATAPAPEAKLSKAAASPVPQEEAGPRPQAAPAIKPAPAPAASGTSEPVVKPKAKPEPEPDTVQDNPF